MKLRNLAVFMLIIPFLLCAGAAAAENAETDFSHSAGDAVYLGRYEQDADTSNGPEPIEWVILDIQDGKALLISRFALDVQPYNLSFMDALLNAEVTWENCGLRAWLNSDFVSAAFSDGELAAVLITDVDNGMAQNPAWSGADGGITQDRVFLLSYAEACGYFTGDFARMCALTAYAAGKGAYTSASFGREDGTDGLPAGCWWLRTSEIAQQYAAVVYPDGSVFHMPAPSVGIAVRPAIWADLDSLD